MSADPPALGSPRAAFSLGEREERYRSIVEHSLDAVLLTAPDGRIMMANAAATELFGYSEEELCRLGRSSIVDAEDPRVRAGLEERRRTGRSRGEIAMKRKDGTRIDVEISSALFRDEDGVECTSMFIRDITARKARDAERLRAQETVRANELLLEAIFKLLPVGLWIADRSGRITKSNPAGERIWAGARYVGPAQFGEYRGWWADTGKRIEPDEWAVARALNKGETSIGEVIRIQCFDDSFKTIINSALPLYDESGAFAGAVIVNEDITQIKAVEEALRRAIAVREHVLGVVAHDLRSPLQVILMQALLLVSTSERRGDLREAKEVIRRQVKHMEKMIEDLLDVTRIEAGTLSLECSALQPQALIDEVLQAHQPVAAGMQIELRAHTLPGTPQVHADRGRIMRVLDNLIGNALKFTRPGGCIEVVAAPGTGEAVFSVADTGIGIEAEAVRHVFERFWQAGADRRGAGLGLAIAKAIVEAHGGRIWVESVPGRGSTFYFSLPAEHSRHSGVGS